MADEHGDFRRCPRCFHTVASPDVLDIPEQYASCRFTSLPARQGMQAVELVKQWRRGKNHPAPLLWHPNQEVGLRLASVLMNEISAGLGGVRCAFASLSLLQDSYFGGLDEDGSIFRRCCARNGPRALTVILFNCKANAGTHPMFWELMTERRNRGLLTVAVHVEAPERFGEILPKSAADFLRDRVWFNHLRASDAP